MKYPITNSKEMINADMVSYASEKNIQAKINKAEKADATMIVDDLAFEIFLIHMWAIYIPMNDIRYQ